MGPVVDIEYWNAVAGGDRDAALTAVIRLHEAGVGSTEIIDGLVQPAQELLGQLWARNEATTAQESRATEINLEVVRWLDSLTPRPPADTPVVLVTGLDTDTHPLPGLTVAQQLAAHGYAVTHVGTPPPRSELTRLAVERQARAVLVSGSLTSSLVQAKRLLAELGAMGVATIVGGPAFGPDGRRARALGATAHAATPRDAAALLAGLPDPHPRVPVPARSAADEEAAWIDRLRDQIASFVIAGVETTYAPQVAASAPPAWWPVLVEHVWHIVGGVAAAVLTHDDRIMAESLAWLSPVLEAREAPPDVCATVFDLLGVTLASQPHSTALMGRLEVDVPATVGP